MLLPPAPAGRRASDTQRAQEPAWVGHFDPDGALTEIRERNVSKSGRERANALAERQGLTARRLARRLGGVVGLATIGTRAMIADDRV